MDVSGFEDQSAARRWLLSALFAVLVASLIYALIGPIAMIAQKMSFNPNEGWNAYWATRALSGQPLYTDAASPISDNYTPLSFYIVAWLGRWLGDPIVAGRIVCLGSLLACGLLVWQIVAELGAPRRWGLAAALCLWLFVAAAAPNYVAINDPQWLCELPMVAALWVLVRDTRSRLSALMVAIACALMLASGLLKPTGIALPIAVTIWLALTDRRSLGVWLAASVAGSILALAWLSSFGPTALSEIVGHERVMHGQLAASAMKTLSPLIPAMIVAAWSVRSWRRRSSTADCRRLLVYLFTAIAILLGIFARLGTGTAQNVHFDAAIGLFILVGVALPELGGTSQRHPAFWHSAVFAAVIAPLIAATLVREPGTIGRIERQSIAERRWAEAIAFVRATPGAVACEHAALCYWAGKPFALDFSNYGQKLRRHDPFGLAERIRRKEFAAIVSIRDKRYRAFNSRLPAAYNRLIEANYRVRMTAPDNVFVLVPRR